MRRQPTQMVLSNNRRTPNIIIHGKTPDASRTSLIFIDPAQRDRARLGVTGPTGTPALQFLNENGDVTHTYPPQ